MKILFTGGGSGGHFYPIIAVAEEINRLAKERRFLLPKLFFMSSDPYNRQLLSENNVTFRYAPAGKYRTYFSLKNFTDLFKTFFGILKSSFEVFRIFPDVIVSKGGYASFPAVFAGRIFRIPTIIHESDSVPGKVNLWAGKFAVRVAVSYAETAGYFPADKVAWTGNPVRRALRETPSENAFAFLKLETGVPVILILEGSQGATLINDLVLRALSGLVEKYQVIHQTGKRNIAEVEASAKVILEKNPHKNRYRPFDYLNDLGMKMSAGAASLIVSRAGSTIFEIAYWGTPAIIIPITDSNGDHQRKNAYNYARSGAAVVIEEKNLAPNILLSEIDRLMGDKEKLAAMSEAGKKFAKPDAAEKIAREILEIALSHEK